MPLRQRASYINAQSKKKGANQSMGVGMTQGSSSNGGGTAGGGGGGVRGGGVNKKKKGPKSNKRDAQHPGGKRSDCWTAVVIRSYKAIDASMHLKVLSPPLQV